MDNNPKVMASDKVEWGTSPRQYREAKRKAFRERVAFIRANASASHSQGAA